MCLYICTYVIRGWNRKQLCSWLTTLGLPDTAKTLYDARIDGECFLTLNDAELENAEEGLGITDSKVRDKLILIIEMLARSLAEDR